MEKETFQLGNKEYIVDESAKEGGEPYYKGEETIEEVHLNYKKPAPTPTPEMLNEAIRELAASTIPPSTIGRDQPGVFRLCKNELCREAGGYPAFVTPLNSGGRPRLFCNPLCANRYHQRKSAKKRRSKSSFVLEKSPSGEQKRFMRTRPTSLEIAKTRYKSHLQKGMCPNATEETGSRCPSHIFGDYHSEKKLCIIYAVMVDDMKEQAALLRGERYRRMYTGYGGEWLDPSVSDDDISIHLTSPTPTEEYKAVPVSDDSIKDFKKYQEKIQVESS